MLRSRVGAELGIVALGGERQRRAALPASDHLRAEQRLLLAARRLRAQVLPVGRDPRVQLAEDDVGAVAAEHLRGRHRRQLARLVRVAEDDLAGLERPLLRVRRRDAAAFDRRLADAVLEAEGGAPGRELVAVLAPDHLDAGQLLVRAPRPLGDRLEARRVGREHRQRDVHVGRAERLLPVLRAALADVAELGRARRHPLPELRREAVERVLRHAERLETVIGEGDGDPGVVRRIGRRPAGVDDRVQPPHQLPSRRAVVDAEQQVGADVRRRSLVQRAALDVVELEAGVLAAGRRALGHRHQWCSGGSGGSGFGGREVGEACARRASSTWSTPSRITGPLPALISSVKIVSITSSLSARPPHVSCARPLAGGELDLQERALLGVRLGDVDDEVVGEHELGQRMVAVRVRRPVGLAVEAVPEGEVGVQPRPVRALVAVGEVERVLHVVEVADLEVAVDRIELLRRRASGSSPRAARRARSAR